MKQHFAFVFVFVIFISSCNGGGIFNRMDSAATAAAVDKNIKLGLAVYERGRKINDTSLYSEAREFYLKALELDSTSPDAWNNTGVTYFESGQPEKALGFFAGSVRKQPKYAAGWYNLGLTYSKLGNRDSSDFALMQSIRAKPSYDDPYQLMLLDYTKAEKLDSLLPLWKQIAVDIKDSAAPCEYLSLLYFKMGDTLGSVHAVEEAAVREPGDVNRLYKLYEYYSHQDDTGKRNYYYRMLEKAKAAKSL